MNKIDKIEQQIEVGSILTRTLCCQIDDNYSVREAAFFLVVLHFYFKIYYLINKTKNNNRRKN